MKKKVKMVWLWAPLLVVGFFPVWSSAADKPDPKALFETRCSMCHALSRPLDKRKILPEWRETVMRMKGLAGGKISDAETETIIKYLAEIRGK